MRTLFINR